MDNYGLDASDILFQTSTWFCLFVLFLFYERNSNENNVLPGMPYIRPIFQSSNERVCPINDMQDGFRNLLHLNWTLINPGNNRSPSKSTDSFKPKNHGNPLQRPSQSTALSRSPCHTPCVCVPTHISCDVYNIYTRICPFIQRGTAGQLAGLMVAIANWMES